MNEVETYERDVPANFRPGLSYVRYHRPTEAQLKDQPEYVADLEDQSWLDHNEKFGGAVEEGRPILGLSMFERMMGILEKETAFESIITSYQADVFFKERIPRLYTIFPTKAQPGLYTAKQVIQDVYNYWVGKRSKLKRPLLRRFWPVTSSDDTNPHLVFRPREKEKYKLRRKRQNDSDSYRKLQQLRADFDNLRAILDLVKRREEIYRLHVQKQVELFEQRLYDAVDSSGQPRRVSKTVRPDQVKQILDVPAYFDMHHGGRLVKSKREHKASTELAPQTSKRVSGGAGAALTNVAGRNSGEPAPNFLHPLETRETFVTSWDGAVPHLPTYQNAHQIPSFRFRHRPRIGRGGRLCVDRLPLPPVDDPSLAPPTVYTAGIPMPRSLKPKERLLDLLPNPLDRASLSRKIEHMSVSAMKEDYDRRTMGTGGDTEENDGEELIVKLDEWLETDDQIWGEERYTAFLL